MVQNAFVRLTNRDSGHEAVRYDLTGDHSGESAILIAEIYRYGKSWKFGAIGKGLQKGLRGMAAEFGVDVA